MLTKTKQLQNILKETIQKINNANIVLSEETLSSKDELLKKITYIRQELIRINNEKGNIEEIDTKLKELIIKVDNLKKGNLYYDSRDNYLGKFKGEENISFNFVGRRDVQPYHVFENHEFKTNNLTNETFIDVTDNEQEGGKRKSRIIRKKKLLKKSRKLNRR